MVLKRKLPSALEGKDNQGQKGAPQGASSHAPMAKSKPAPKPQPSAPKPQPSAPTPQATAAAPSPAPQKTDPFAGLGSDTMPKGKAPIAPEPKVQSGSSAIPNQPSAASKPTQPQAPVAPVASFDELPESDFDLPADISAPVSTKVEDDPFAASMASSTPQTPSWDEEPQDGLGWDFENLDGSDDDIFGSMAKEAEKVDAPLPPWQQGSVAGDAPELPGSQPSKMSTESKTEDSPQKFTEGKADPKGALIGIAMLALVGFGVYKFFVEKEDTTEVISRWTGSLNEVSEEIPAVSKGSSSDADSVLQPETLVSMEKGEIKPAPKQEQQPEAVVEDDAQPMEDEIAAETPKEAAVFSIGGKVLSDRELNVSTDVLKVDNVNKNVEPVEVKSAPKSDTVVEFVDVSEDQVEKPIQASGAIDMPEDVGMVAQLQQAINKARMEKNPDDFKPTVPEKSESKELEMLTPDELDARNRELSEQLEAELAEYRRILSGEDGEKRKIKPDEFFDEKARQMEGLEEAGTATASGSIPLPKRKSALISEKDAQSIYGSNPYNLPVVAEPSTQTVKGVRTIDDFNVSMFQVEREKVRIPQHIQPSMRGSVFPKMYLLSTVVDKGIVAEMGDKQGVLLVGETVSGWELISVKAEYAEFSNGKRKHIVSIGR